MIVPKLPTELWLEILRLALPERNLKRILRLRLVNRLFASAILDMLPGHPLLSAHLSNTTLSLDPRPPVSLESAHLVHFLNSGNEANSCHHLAVIKEVAIALAKGDTAGRTVDDFLTLVCPLAVSKYENIDLWRPNFYWSIYMPDNKYTLFPTELFVAALHTQVTSLVVDMCQKYPWQWNNGYSLFFGNAYEAATANGSNHHLIKTLVLNDRFNENMRRAFLRYAVEHGDLDLVKLIWNHNTDKHPWTFAQFPRESYDGHRNNRLLSRMHTPSVQVFEWLMEKRRTHCVGKIFGIEQWSEFLVRCAGRGWIDMAKHYIELGAPVDGEGYTKGLYGYQSPDGTRMWPAPLICAVSSGRRDIIEVLLARDARVDKYILEVAIKRGDVDVAEMLLGKGIEDLDIKAAITLAVRKGNARMVKMLFGHFTDVGEVAQELLVHAVRMENDQMVRILVKRGGGVVAESVRKECLKTCREEGLESMERLLDELQPAQS